MVDARRIAAIVLTGAAVPLSFVAAPYPEQMILQHVPTVIGLALLLAVTLRTRISGLSFACSIAFLWLHIIGARWLYSYVPYDELARHLTGTSLSELFGWQRNHYDRLVHAAFGVLAVPPISELLQRCCGIRPEAAAVLSVACVAAVGAAYEIFEWLIAVTLSPERAEAYNGQQGDVWDPQKDLALAGLGSIVSAVLVGRWRAAA